MEPSVWNKISLTPRNVANIQPMNSDWLMIDLLID